MPRQMWLYPYQDMNKNGLKWGIQLNDRLYAFLDRGLCDDAVPPSGSKPNIRVIPLCEGYPTSELSLEWGKSHL